MDMTANLQETKKWYVVYTRSRTEKKVCAELNKKNIECFLPLQKKLRKWKDRKKWVEVPLISGYCFVHINRKEYDSVLKSDHVVCYITFEGKAAVIRPYEIKQLKQMLRQSDFEVTVSNENFTQGQKVEIIKGPLMGLKGELVNCRGKKRFILRISQFKNVFSVEVPADCLTGLPDTNTIHTVE